MVLKTIKFMRMSAVRQLCIKQNYCTCCNNTQYGDMLFKCEGAKEDNEILNIAKEIFDYSDTEQLMKEAGCSEKELLSAICFNLLNDCCYIITEIED